MYTENDYLMWLSCILSLGVGRANYLLQYFGSAEEIWRASSKELSEKFNISEKVLHKMVETKNEELMEKRLEKLEHLGIKFIGISEKEYPYMLKEIQEPPIGIYVIGELPKEEVPKVSIVGSRRCSPYGSDVAYKFSKELAEKGIVVISGMAEGIDSVAHRGALDGGGETIAVFGNGADICYPAFNGELKKRIIKSGCVISEYPPGIKPQPYYFPARNRIISGMSLATIVVEAKEKSGTLITVGQALEQGRDVFAVPGNITNERSRGTNELIKQGAYVLTKTEDILDVLGIEANQNNKINNKKLEVPLATDEKLVYDCISSEPISVDELIIKTGKEIGKLQYILTLLEIKGVVQKVSGQRYIRSW